MLEALYRLYEDKLWLEAKHWRMPEHIGIILDGNRRFAKEQRAAVLAGHRHGADKLDEVLAWCGRAGVRVVSVWAFSIDNFKRAPDEVAGLMRLFEEKFLALCDDRRVHEDEIRVRSFGRVELLPESVRTALKKVEHATKGYTHRTLNIGIAYGGREEICDAFRRYVEEGGDPLAVTPEAIDKHLYTAHVPHPDLIIRTSGEVRLSGFMLWQSAYSELFFCDTNWPAFREVDFLRALRSYSERQRRFGK